MKSAFKRWVFTHASFFYLSSILLLTTLIVIALLFAAHLPAF